MGAHPDRIPDPAGGSKPVNPAGGRSTSHAPLGQSVLSVCFAICAERHYGGWVIIPGWAHTQIVIPGTAGVSKPGDPARGRSTSLSPSG